MHPRLTEVFEYIDARHEELRAAYDAVPVDRRAKRPAPNEWSANDVITHLTLIERRVGGMFAAKIQEARAAGLPVESDDSSVLPTAILAKALDRDSKITAPSAADPLPLTESMSWSDYEQARAQLKQSVLAGDGLAIGQISHSHPIFGPLSLYEWVALSGGHAARHAAQIRDVARRLDAN